MARQHALNPALRKGHAATSIGDPTAPPPSPPVDNLIDDSQVPTASRLESKIQAVVDGVAQSPDVSVSGDKEGVVIRLSGSYLFASSRAEMKPHSVTILHAVSAALPLQRNHIRVHGHPDP